jgi:regulator of sigma E protease
LNLSGLTREKKAGSAGEACAMSLDHTRNSVIDIYLTLRNLVVGDLSVKSLHGPIGIAKTAAIFAEEGLPDFLLFLGLISINLAVINFLPIPVLDGGHMVFLIWEGLTRRRPSERVVVAATYVGLAFVASLMVAVIYIDLFVVKK